MLDTHEAILDTERWTSSDTQHASHTPWVARSARAFAHRSGRAMRDFARPASGTRRPPSASWSSETGRRLLTEGGSGHEALLSCSDPEGHLEVPPAAVTGSKQEPGFREPASLPRSWRGTRPPSTPRSLLRSPPASLRAASELLSVHGLGIRIPEGFFRRA